MDHYLTLDCPQELIYMIIYCMIEYKALYIATSNQKVWTREMKQLLSHYSINHSLNEKILHCEDGILLNDKKNWRWKDLYWCFYFYPSVSTWNETLIEALSLCEEPTDLVIILKCMSCLCLDGNINMRI